MACVLSDAMTRERGPVTAIKDFLVASGIDFEVSL